MDVTHKGTLRYCERQMDTWQETQLWDKRLPDFSSLKTAKASGYFGKKTKTLI